MATGHTPFSLTFGLEAVVPMEYVVPSLRLVVTARPSPEDFVQSRMQKLLELDEKRLHSAWTAQIVQQRRKLFVDRNRKFRIFEVGDVVLLFNSRTGPHPGKLQLRWTVRALFPTLRGFFPVRCIYAQHSRANSSLFLHIK